MNPLHSAEGLTMKRILIITLTLFLASQAQAGVVVSAGIDKLSGAEIKRLYLGKIDSVGGIKVKLADFEPLKSAFLGKVLGKNKRAYKRLWMKKLFSDGEEIPSSFKSALMLTEFLKQHPNAIGYLPAPPEDGSLRVLLEF